MNLGLIVVKDYSIQISSEHLCCTYPLSVTQLSADEIYFGEDSDNVSILHFGHTDRSLLLSSEDEHSVGKGSPKSLSHRLDNLFNCFSVSLEQFSQHSAHNAGDAPSHIAICLPHQWDKERISLVATAAFRLNIPLMGIFYTEVLATAPLPIGRYLYLGLNQRDITLSETEKTEDSLSTVKQVLHTLPVGHDELLNQLIDAVSQQFLEQHKLNIKKSVDLEQKVYSSVSAFLLSPNNRNGALSITIENKTLEMSEGIITNTLHTLLPPSEKIDYNRYQGMTIDESLSGVMTAPIGIKCGYSSPNRLLNNLKNSVTLKTLSDEFQSTQAPKLIKSLHALEDPTYKLTLNRMDERPTHLLVNHRLYPIHHLPKKTLLYLFAEPPYLSSNSDANTDESSFPASVTQPSATIQIDASCIHLTPNHLTPNHLIPNDLTPDPATSHHSEVTSHHSERTAQIQSKNHGSSVQIRLGDEPYSFGQLTLQVFSETPFH